jgi:hypothetical protein
MRRALYLFLLVSGLSSASEELRYEGFTDREIHEIQLVLQELTTGEIIYISGAKKGCVCEEGTQCTSQVTVVTRQNEKDSTWPLSQFEGKWAFGKVFRWQRQFDAFLKEMKEIRLKPLAIRQEFAKNNRAKYDALMAAKPQCTTAAPQEREKVRP